MMLAPLAFFRETYDEIKKVTWPSRNQVIRLTSVVIAISVLVGLYIGALDYLMTKVMEFILR